MGKKDFKLLKVSSNKTATYSKKLEIDFKKIAHKLPTYSLSLIKRSVNSVGR